MARSSDCFDVMDNRLAEGTRKAVDAWGLKLLCQEPRWRSNALTVISVPSNIDSADVVTHAYAKYNLTIGVGLGQVSSQHPSLLIVALLPLPYSVESCGHCFAAVLPEHCLCHNNELVFPVSASIYSYD